MFDSEFEKELRSLGMTPAEIRAAVTEKKAATDKVAELEGRITATTTELETTKGNFAETKARLDLLEANSRRPEPKNDGEPKTKTSFLDDEDKAFSERLVEGLAPTAMMAFTAAKTAARMSARASLFGMKIQTPNGPISLVTLWDRWLPDIDAAANDMQRTNAAALQYERTWLNLFDYIKGRKVDELMAKPESFIESGNSNVDRKIGDAPRPDKLTDDESELIKKQSRYGKGITPEKILEIRKKMNFVNA